jgi:hypothetical protein
MKEEDGWEKGAAERKDDLIYTVRRTLSTARQ